MTRVLGAGALIVAIAALAAAPRAEAACGPAAAKQLVHRFVADYDGGRVGAADALVARWPAFRWFSAVGPEARLRARAYDRATLARWFRARARAHERLRLTRLDAGYDPARGIVNFSGRLVRSADDLRPRRQWFKGATACRSGLPVLIVWSM